MKFNINPFRKKIFTEEEILNSGLYFAMEFGENWLQPIQERLLKKYDFLKTSELDHYDKIVHSAMNEGHKFVYDNLTDLCDKKQQVKSDLLQKNLSDFILDKYQWVSDGNIRRLYSQACYYAYKDGLTSAIE
jgi:hypothetical protein